jgi:SsrA-binding protein
VLLGTKIKAIRKGRVNIQDAFCHFTKNTELFVQRIHISLYDHGNIYNHDPYRFRKLLLKKRELLKLHGKLDIGMSIVPTQLFINDKNLAKLEIALVRGKKMFDKREAIKKRDMERHFRTNDYEDI